MLREAGLGGLGAGLGLADGELPLDIEGRAPSAKPMEPTRVHELMGLGGWKLGREVHPILALLGAQIEGAWREFLLEDMRWIAPPGLYEDDVEPRLRAASLRLHEYVDTLGVAAFYDAIEGGATEKEAFDIERAAHMQEGPPPLPPTEEGRKPPTTRSTESGSDRASSVRTSSWIGASSILPSLISRRSTRRGNSSISQ